MKTSRQPGTPVSWADGRRVVAIDDGRLVGAGCAYRYWLHPMRWRLAVYVVPGARRSGIGTALVDAIVERLPPGDRWLQAAVSASDAAGGGFLGDNGFELLMTTRLGTLDPRRVVPDWLESARREHRGLEADGYRFASLETRPALGAKVAHFHGRIYRNQHGWDPPIPLRPEQCVALFMDASELDPAMQFLAIRDETIHAVASLRTTDRPSVLDLGWIGATGALGVHVARLYRSLVAMCLDAAARRGAAITLEVDRVDPVTNGIMDVLPVEWDDDWLTFARE